MTDRKLLDRISAARAAKLRRRSLPAKVNVPLAVEKPKRNQDSVAIANNDEAWTQVVDAMRKALKSRTQANIMDAMTKLKAFEYDNGLPSLLFGKSTERFRALVVELLEFEEQQDDADLEVVAPKILDEFAALYENGEVVIPSLAKRTPNDAFRGQTIRPQTGDVVRGGFAFFVHDASGNRVLGKVDSNNPQLFVVEHAGFGRGKLADVWVVELSPLIDPRNGDPRWHNPMNDRITALISSKQTGEDTARFTGRLSGDNPNGLVVVSQMYRTFVAYSEAQLRELDASALRISE